MIAATVSGLTTRPPIAGSLPACCEDWRVSEQGGRYQRTTSGLIGAMIVILLVIGAFVAFRALNRDELETQPEPVDYLEQAAIAQEAGVDVVYPRALPPDWIATSVELTPGEHRAWGLGMLTDDERFAGIRQEDASLEDLLATYVDEVTTVLPAIDVAGSVAPHWQAFEDAGGDLAFAAEVGGDVVLVYGSADEADLTELIGDLTTQPVAQPSG